MTDTMTSQNIDLSSWDTLYIRGHKVTILHEPKQTDTPNSGTTMPLKHVCTYNDIKDNNQV
jgi:hypothetical protein